MKLIWLGHFIPYPPRGGAHQRSYHLLRQASRNHEIILVAFNRPRVDAETLETYRAGLQSFCSVIEFWEMPFAWKGPRWWAGLAANTVQSLPYSCEIYRSGQLLTRWKKILQEHPDAMVHIDSSDLAVFAEGLSGHRVLLNHHNCESVMAARRAALEPNLAKRIAMSAQAKKQAALEAILCAEVTVNAVVSAVDGESLRLQCPSAHVHVVENGTDTDYFLPQPGSIEPNSLVFAGSMNWYPNISGLRYFRERIWPRLKTDMAGIKLFVAGFSPGGDMKEWAKSEPALTLVANPEDIRPWIAKGAVFVCPIVDGGGTRLKLLDAMSAGKAIVSTRIGAEGLGIEEGKQALVAGSEEEFADLTLKALRSASLRESLAQNARKFVEERYSWDIIGRSLEQAYTCAATHGNTV